MKLSLVLLAMAVASVLLPGVLRGAEPKSAAPTAPAAAVPSGARKSMAVNVLDARGKPIPEFRVIAGVKSSFRTAQGQEVISWQPHTVRVGEEGVLHWPMTRAYDSMALRVEADGYAPQISAWVEKNKAQDVEIRLAEDAGTAARVLTPEGRPASRATVALAMVQREAVLENGLLRHAQEPPPRKDADLWRWPRFVMADADGRFQLPAENDPTAAVLIVHDSGVSEMALAEFKKAPQVTLRPWGRVDGRAQWGDVVGTNRLVSLSVHRDTYGYPGVVAQYEKTISDPAGTFTFPRVLPGSVQISCPIAAPSGGKSGITQVNFPGLSTHPNVQPGTNAVVIGGVGRTVTGRLTGRDSWADVTFHLHPNAPHIGRGGDDDMWAAWTAWQQSSMGPAFFRNALKVKMDGSFEIPGVLPGNYQIFFKRAGEPQHVATGSIVVPAEVSGVSPEPQDMGELRCRPAP